MKVRLEATLVSDTNTENFNESAHETFTKALNEQRANAEQDNNWAPRLYITKAGYGADGQFHWEADIQFGWQDSPSYEGFKLIGSVPTSSDESLHLHRRINYSVKPSLIKGDKETRKMTITAKGHTPTRKETPTMSNHRYNPEPYIQDAISQITSDIRHAANTNNPRYLADKAEDIARFAQALATITLHQYNIILDPRLADNEEYMRVVCAGYSVELANWSAPLEVNTRIHVADKKTRNEINLRNRKVKHMQVTGYDIPTQTHELTFTLKDGTTRTATATYTNFREIAILENLRLTETILYPYSNFATRKASDKNTLDLHIDTRIHP